MGLKIGMFIPLSNFRLYLKN